MSVYNDKLSYYMYCISVLGSIKCDIVYNSLKAYMYMYIPDIY